MGLLWCLAGSDRYCVKLNHDLCSNWIGTINFKLNFVRYLWKFYLFENLSYNKILIICHRHLYFDLYNTGFLTSPFCIPGARFELRDRSECKQAASHEKLINKLFIMIYILQKEVVDIKYLQWRAKKATVLLSCPFRAVFADVTVVMPSTDVRTLLRTTWRKRNGGNEPKV